MRDGESVVWIGQVTETNAKYNLAPVLFDELLLTPTRPFPTAMPPGAKRRPPSLASQVGGPGDTIEAAVRALEALSGQEGQEDQNSPLLLNFLLPPSRPSFPKPTPTTPPKRNWKASSSASTSSSSSPSSPPDAVIRNNNKRDVTPDEFPHPHQRLSNGGYSLVDCWQFHGRSHCPVSRRYQASHQLILTHQLEF